MLSRTPFSSRTAAGSQAPTDPSILHCVLVGFGQVYPLPVANTHQSSATPAAPVTPAFRRRFVRRLLAWWDAHGRKDLPWQRCRTPYRVWVSEIMLQQTQAVVVAAYFERFVARFPDMCTLAGADLDEVLHLWSGLGYYARVRNLHRAAGVVLREHGGVLPCDPAVLATLPGIGRSTAGAIAAQAHGLRAPILDANAKRLLARHFRVAGPPASAATAATLWELADALTPAQRVADYTQAVMDVGAKICRPRQPRCAACPVRATCAALAVGDADRFPERKRPRPRPLTRRRFFVVADPQGACYVEQRPRQGVWGGLWSPPERCHDESAQAFLAHAGMDAKLVRAMHVAPTLRHGFSHFDLDAQPVYVHLTARPAAAAGRWIDPRRHSLGLSALAAKLLAGATPLELD